MESTPQEDAEGHAIVQVLAVVLDRLVSANSLLSSSSQQEDTKFHASRAPAIGVLQYLERIQKYASCSKECFIFALIYIDRLIQRNNFLLTDLNVHRVVITAVLLAAKFFDDAYYNNAYYAKVGGVLTSEMNTLECEFLFKIDFSLRVVPEVFEKYSAELIAHSGAMGLDRITNCTDEELFRRVCSRQHEQAMAAEQQRQVNNVIQAPPAQVPVMRTYSQPEPDAPVVYPTVTQAVCHQEAHAAPVMPHYPIQALHRSMMELTTQQLQQHAMTAALDPVFPFPNLATQVSVQQQAQPPPSHNPSELDLVYHSTATTPASTVASQYTATTASSAAPQKACLSQYASQALALQQAPLMYSQAELMDAVYHGNLTTPAAAPMLQAPAYARMDRYYAGGAVQGHHPEITPSPPPQPTVHLRHGARLPAACDGYQHAGNLAGSLAGDPAAGGGAADCPKPLAAAPAGFGQPLQHICHHPQHHRPHASLSDAALGQQLTQQLALPSRPIAITENHVQISREQDNVGGGGWPSMAFSLERAGARRN